MKSCLKCGRECADEAVRCPNCGNAMDNSVSEDRINVGLCILSSFIPLFGIIYWVLKGKETPRKARTCGIVAIVSWVVSFVCSFLFSFAIGLLGVI